MGFLGPLNDIPELQGLDRAEALRVAQEAQKHVTRQPAILGGLLASLLVVSLILFIWFPVGGLIGGTMIGALIGLVAAIYLSYVVKPRMREHLRTLGYPRDPGST